MNSPVARTFYIIRIIFVQFLLYNPVPTNDIVINIQFNLIFTRSSFSSSVQTFLCTKVIFACFHHKIKDMCVFFVFCFVFVCFVSFCLFFFFCENWAAFTVSCRCQTYDLVLLTCLACSQLARL